MFEVRRPDAQPSQKDDGAPPALAGMDPDKPGEASPEELMRHRHRTLMELLDYEGDRQSEERMQMQIDEDYQDHLQWRPEDAQALIERGQAPLVFNEGRQTIDWIAGTEQRTRTDYRVLPRRPEDEAVADVKTKLVKYTDDVNQTVWHRSKAFKQAATAGLSWLEEGVNPDPEQEIIYSGMEDWRNVIRDSHSRHIDYNVDARYQFRRRIVDLDYACALLPNNEDVLHAAAGRHDDLAEGDDVWYLGARLTGASETEWSTASAIFGERGAYMARNGYFDHSRRRAVELLECWYRTPSKVQVFAGGPLAGRVVNQADPMHQQVLRDAPKAVYEAVKFRMNLQLATRQAPCLDMPSPFRHQKFLLVPVWGYRRARDGMAYGVWRGMRDIQDDLNKRRSKALFALSANRMQMEENTVDDIEDARIEAARPDGILITKRGKRIVFEKNMADFQANLELAEQDSQLMRNVGGVTNENLGQDTNAVSGKAILAKQNQGGLTTAELFDNLNLAVLNAGRLRLSHIEQFYTDTTSIRIAGQAQPLDWVHINKPDPVTGQLLNDVTATEADFIVDTQSYRASMAQAALDQMFELLGKVATFAPQVVLAVLDLLVDSSEVPGKAEWVARIRKINGQRDPSKPPTPQEQQAELAQQQMQAAQQQLMLQTGQANLGKLQADIDLARAQISKLDTEDILKKVETMYSALQAAQIVATVPGVTPAADAITASAGMTDAHPEAIPVPAQAAGPAPVDQPQPGPSGPGGIPQQPGPLVGADRGINTPTGADNLAPPQP